MIQTQNIQVVNIPVSNREINQIENTIATNFMPPQNVTNQSFTLNTIAPIQRNNTTIISNNA